MPEKTKTQLLAENRELRGRLAELERVQAEDQQNQEELRRSEARWRSVVENAPLFIAVVDESGSMQFLNHFRPGFDPAMVVGRPVYDFLQPEYHDVARKSLQQVFQTGEPASYECSGAGPEGTVSEYVTDVGPVILDGKIIAATLISRDLTDRKRAERAQQQERNLARQYLDVAGVMMVALDEGGNVRLLNRKGCAVLGYDEEDLLGKNWFDTCLPQDIRAEVRWVFKQFVTGEAAFAEYYDNPVITRSGEERIITWHNAVLRDERGAFLGTLSSGLDITDRKRAEEELARNRVMLEATVECLPFDFFAIGADGHYVLENAACRAHWGRLVGKRPEDMAPSLEVRDLWLSNNRRAFAGEKIESDATVTVNGEERVVHQLVTPIRDQSHFYGILGVNIDITERKRAEEALQKAHHDLERRVEQRTAELSALNEQLRREIEERKHAVEALQRSEERYRAVVEDQTEVIGRFDAEGVFTFVNEVFCRFFGKTSQELLGRKWQPVAVAEDLPKIDQQLRSLSPDNPIVVVENRVYSGQGEVRWMQFVNRGFFDENGRLTEVQAVGRDITQRKEAEEALRRSEESLRQSERRFRNYFEQGLIGMAVTSVDKRWLEVNDRLCEMLGYSREELVQTDWVTLTHPEDVEPNFRLFTPLLAGEIEHFTLDKRYFRKDGSILYTTIHTRAFRTPAGEVDHIVTLIEDITTRKLAEEALERERKTLWHMLQASDHERQLIAYEIHDGFTQLVTGAMMQFQAYELLKDEQSEKAKMAFVMGGEMLQMAHAEARRLISGVRPPVLDEAGVETAIAHLVHDERILTGPKIEFHGDVQFHRLPSILENALYRIAQEALANACKHSQSNRVKVTLIQEDNKIRLAVQDWGTGFDPGAIKEGHFGLEGIRERVRLLGGQLSIETGMGSGTLIQVVVPIVERRSGEG